MEKGIEKVVMIGAGNVGTRLALALKNCGLEIIQVYSRSLDSAGMLARKLDCDPATDLKDLKAHADLYIVAISDDAIPEVAERFPYPEKLLVHTSGSTSMDVLEDAGARHGVFYPLQTFSKEVEVDFSQIPVCIEAAHEEDMAILKQLASRLTSRVYLVSSEERLLLHVAAVFACNFTNHMYAIAEDILTRYNLDFEMLRPLIRETARKAMHESPAGVQTGPAVRKNEKVMKKHLEILSALGGYQKIYNFISESIIDKSKPEKY